MTLQMHVWKWFTAPRPVGRGTGMFLQVLASGLILAQHPVPGNFPAPGAIPDQGDVLGVWDEF